MTDSTADRTDDPSSTGSSSTDSSSNAPSTNDPSANEGSSDDSAGDEFDDPPVYESTGSGLGGRDVEVPMRIYKTVTVFSTLIAVVCVVAGFVVLDRATGRATLPLAEVDPILAVVGIAVILFGAVTYAFGTRFRARGMGRSKNDDDESGDNG